jgi:hypothetical protein
MIRRHLGHNLNKLDNFRCTFCQICSGRASCGIFRLARAAKKAGISYAAGELAGGDVKNLSLLNPQCVRSNQPAPTKRGELGGALYLQL